MLKQRGPVFPRLRHPYTRGVLEAGIDEAGRGCGAGPVVAAAVILPPRFYHPQLRDSKKINFENRNLLRDVILKKAITYAIGVATVEEIDSINILEATYLAMHRAIYGLQSRPELLLIDGNRFKNNCGIRHETIIRGDDRITSIAAASILAKTYRDHLMKELHHDFPHYLWDKNKGYLTPEHRSACETYGLCQHHRTSFRILTEFGQEVMEFED